MASLTDFFENSTKSFSGVVEQGGSNPDITGDTVRLLIKKYKNDSDGDAVLSKDASTAAAGVFSFLLTPTDTTIEPGEYHYLIEWITAGGNEYPLEQDTFTVKNKLSDN